jgi:hypothetical protein
MGATASSYALKAGMFAGYCCLLSPSIGVLQPSPLFNVDKFRPVYEWFLKCKLPKEKDVRAAARALSLVELCLGLIVILPEEKTPGFAVCSLLFIYGAGAHVAGKDGMWPVAAALACCSLSALVANLIDKEK